MEKTDPPIIVEPPGDVRHCVILLHGLGADGHDFAGIQEMFGLPPNHGIRFIYPHAPHRPVTINGGYVMRAWYDIYGLTADSPEDEAGLAQAEAFVGEILAQQYAEGLSPESIVLAGFSQGGAVALITALRQARSFAGVLALSAYLPLADQMQALLQQQKPGEMPIFMAHGELDDVVPLSFGQVSRERLEAMGREVEWRTYPMAHSVCDDEINDIGVWLRRLYCL